MKTNLKVFLKGIIDVSPLMIPVVPFGLIFGILAVDIGFSPLATMGMSLIIFGGASQIVLLQLFSGGASSFQAACRRQLPRGSRSHRSWLSAFQPAPASSRG